MATLRFRIYWEDDDSIYRDVAIRHQQTFEDLHKIILKSFEFDNKHQATFYRSNDSWQEGREISLEKYDRAYKVDPLVMKEVAIGNEIRIPNQKFIYEYDFAKSWRFMVELIGVDKEEKKNIEYPCMLRKEGIAPSQYGLKAAVDSRLAEMEEKYDLNPDALNEGFGEEGEEGEDSTESDESPADDQNEIF